MLYDREAPPEVLAQLREVDPRVRLLYMGVGSWKSQDGREWTGSAWQLGVVHQDVAALAETTVRLERLWPARDAFAQRRIEILREQREGFVGLDIVPEEDLWNGRLVADFRRADWLARHRLAQILSERTDQADTQTGMHRRIDVIREYLGAEGDSVHRHAMRRRKTFLQPGLN